MFNINLVSTPKQFVTTDELENTLLFKPSPIRKLEAKHRVFRDNYQQDFINLNGYVDTHVGTQADSYNYLNGSTSSVSFNAADVLKNNLTNLDL